VEEVTETYLKMTMRLVGTTADRTSI